MSYTFPSLKNAEKLPQIVLDGDNSVQRYRDWLSESGIVPTVPPLHEDFVLRYSCSFGGRRYDYADIVHYTDDLTGFIACHSISGKKALEVECSYLENDTPGIVSGHASAPASSPYREDWLRSESSAVCTAVIATQAYILYHRPELIPTVLPEPQRRTSKKPYAAKRAAYVARERRQIIRLGDPGRLPVAKNYRAIQWQVRGHYRRLKNPDRLVYIRPHTAQRGKKKLSPAPIIVKEAPND